MEISKIKPIKKLEDGMGQVFIEEIELWRHIADYYMCTVGEVYKAAYPYGKTDLEESRAAAKLKAEERKARQRESLKLRIDKLEKRIEKKQELLSKARKESTRETYAKDIERLEREKAFFMSTLDPEWKLGHHKESAESSGMTDEVRRHILSGANDIHTASNPSLTPAQQKAAEEIRSGFANEKPVLLNGVTGSGKTEIYITLALEAMKQGRNVLYLVPEISLSRQLEERLEKYFGDSLMPFHSRETAASKRNTAEQIRDFKDGKGNYIVLGTRSSLFLPHHNLGLIIVDEEHDTSYKQDSPAPRYNGRDTALILSLIHKSNIILGSATPSLEELYNCSMGRHVQVILSERFHGSEDSEIEIIDTRAERRKNGMKGSFSRKLIAQIEDTLSKNEQVIILRARRSWAPAIQCGNCGEIQKCPHCNVAMSLHKGSSGQSMSYDSTKGPHQQQQPHTGRMVCHWCGYKSEFTGRCSKCGGELATFGAGTQKIEEEAAALFPAARIARLDSDTVQNRNFEKKTIKEFSEGKIDILIGTQIVTKGFDFSNLSLVAVIAADSLLGVQDFRADEKALQLLQQLRGRCGRRSERGKFVIQTAQPEHPIYTNLSNSRAGCFSLDLMQERQDFGYPPYSRIVEIEIKDSFEDRAERMAGRLRRKLGNMNITGPYKPSVSKVADKHIQMLRISLAKDRNLKSNKENIRNAILNFEKENRYDGHITINVDPS
jgi:primosomal protein N' (replication factor Y)